ncbi:MbtH family NRPS accessory protein [Kitasatospora sp. NPDC059088]|uniref:MbtH family NRPS accessory protein n=1 Tax=Kitasatospora sp. NPDC059088 TaxID=3346722 RepID=UPI0036B56463
MSTDYTVVYNSEEQYSVWRADTEPPAGWTTTGFTGTRDECLDRIDAEWTDMRPRSLREHLAAVQQ